MGSNNRFQGRRKLCGLALLAVLVGCAFAGSNGNPRDVVQVAVTRKDYTLTEMERDLGYTSKDAAARAEEERAQEKAMLERIAVDEAAAEKTREQAIEQLRQIAERMETEVQVRACLAHMGIENTGVVCGGQMLTLILEKEKADTQEESVQILDAVSSLTGYDAADIKIILSKK